MARKPSPKFTKGSSEANGQDPTPRHLLPIPDVTPIALTTFDARDPDTKYSPIRQIRPPQGAPNVLVVLIDDAGFGSSSAFGGPCQTPNFEKLAANGLKYTRFHTTALCSPTRAALLSGTFAVTGKTRAIRGEDRAFLSVVTVGPSAVEEREAVAAEPWRGNERRYHDEASYSGPERRVVRVRGGKP
jgi:arylsulfatase